MNEFFFWMMAIISLIFFVVILIISVCQWIIYFRVENTLLGKSVTSESSASYKEVK